MQSSDPRTWIDFSDPAAHGFERIDCETAFEWALRTGAIAMAMAAAVVLIPDVHWPAGLGLSADAMSIVAAGLVVGALLLWGLRSATDNFYLIDRARHAVYFHFQVLTVRRVRLLLEHQEILAMAVDTQRSRRNRYSDSWWEHRAVLIDMRGNVVPMGNWLRDGLWTANNMAREIANELSCPCYESPADSRLVVRLDGPTPTVAFKEYSWLRRYW